MFVYIIFKFKQKFGDASLLRVYKNFTKFLLFQKLTPGIGTCKKMS